MITELETKRLELAQSLGEVGRILRTYKRRVDATISPNDEMFTGDKNVYLTVGYSALALIVYAMLLSGCTSPARILDLPCGHGRVLRMLRAAFPTAEIVACDINRDAVDFCARQFQAIPVYSDPEPNRIPIPGTFDLIWCGSLITHIDAARARAFVEFLADRVHPNGLLVLTTHGRTVLTRGAADDDAWEHVVQGYSETGFGYRDRRETVGWGISVTKPSWMLELLSRQEDLSVLAYVERGWNDHQDVVAAVKTAINHRQGERLVV